MAYEIRVVEGKRPSIEETLNKQAGKGWQLVSCWPEKENIIGVFQKPTKTPSVSLQPSLTPNADAPPSPSESSTSLSLTLDEILAACQATPIKKDAKGNSFHEGLSVAQFAKKKGVTSEIMLDALMGLGLNKKKDKDDKGYMKFLKGGDSLYLKQSGKYKAWYVCTGNPRKKP